MQNQFGKIRVFTGEMFAEVFKKASWPTFQELRESTLLVIFASLLMGLFTSLSDFSLYQVVDLVSGWVR